LASHKISDEDRQEIQALRAFFGYQRDTQLFIRTGPSFAGDMAYWRKAGWDQRVRDAARVARITAFSNKARSLGQRREAQWEDTLTYDELSEEDKQELAALQRLFNHRVSGEWLGGTPTGYSDLVFWRKEAWSYRCRVAYNLSLPRKGSRAPSRRRKP
jgi:hypothetical protein